MIPLPEICSGLTNFGVEGNHAIRAVSSGDTHVNRVWAFRFRVRLAEIVRCDECRVSYGSQNLLRQSQSPAFASVGTAFALFGDVAFPATTATAARLD